MAKQNGFDEEKRGIKTYYGPYETTNIETSRDFDDDNSVNLGSTEEVGLKGANTDNAPFKVGGSNPYGYSKG